MRAAVDERSAAAYTLAALSYNRLGRSRLTCVPTRHARPGIQDRPENNVDVNEENQERSAARQTPARPGPSAGTPARTGRQRWALRPWRGQRAGALDRAGKNPHAPHGPQLARAPARPAVRALQSKRRGGSSCSARKAARLRSSIFILDRALCEPCPDCWSSSTRWLARRSWAGAWPGRSRWAVRRSSHTVSGSLPESFVNSGPSLMHLQSKACAGTGVVGRAGPRAVGALLCHPLTTAVRGAGGRPAAPGSVRVRATSGRRRVPAA